MLSEGFLRVLRYREGRHDSVPVPDSLTQAAQDPQAKYEVPDLNQRLELQGPGVPSQPHPAIYIPTQQPQQEPLITWSCTSFCLDYPDLQLGRDQVCGSESLGLDSKPRVAPRLPSPDPTELRPPQLQRALLRPEEAHHEGCLVTDSSITTLRNGEPLTNSMLNSYLESKLQELYSQYLQESLARPGSSPGCNLLPPFAHPGVQQQLSQQLSQQLGLELDVTRSAVLSYLNTQRAASRMASSHFSSPVLRISDPEQVTRPAAQ